MLYPQTNPRRLALKLDGIWHFAKDPEDRGRDARWFHRPPTETIPMPVPAAFNEMTEDPELRDYFGAVWYFKHFDAPEHATELRLLRFGAAVYHAEVWLNGVAVGESHRGKLPFELDVTGQLCPTGNLLAVRIDTTLSWETIPPGTQRPLEPGHGIAPHQAPEYHFDFLNFGGLLRSVWLLCLPTAHVKGLFLTTLKDEDRPTGWKIHLEATEILSVRYRVMDDSGETVAEGAASSPDEPVDLLPDGPRAWCPDSPVLYTLEITLGDRDRYTQKIGLRTVRVTPDAFLLNGEPIYLKGFGLHEDFHLVGQGHSDARLVRDLTLLKNMGGNSFRTSHYPYDEAAYQLADELGILVIDETAAVGMHSWWKYPMFDGTRINANTLALHKQMVTELVRRDHYHPCVILWSLANEVACYEAAADGYFRELFAHCRAVDPARLPVTVVQSSLPGAVDPNNRSHSARYADLICWNRYYGWYTDPGHLEVIAQQLEREALGWREEYPDKPVMITEFGADAVAGFHGSPPTMFTEEYQKETIARYCEVLDRLDFVVGEHVWNLCDFMTKQGVNRVFGNRKGVHTRDRQPKYAAHYLRERWKR